MVNVSSLLTPTKKRLGYGLEETAARLAAGETVPPDEIAVVLERTRSREHDLQRAVDRHARVLGFRRELKAAEPLRKKLADIEAELAAAEAGVAQARRQLNTVVERHGETLIDLRVRVDVADRARRSLMDLENLPPDLADNLVEARRAADEASDAHTSAAAAVAEAHRRLQQAEEELPKALERSKVSQFNDDYKADVTRLRNGIKARRTALAEAEKAMAEAVAAMEASRAVRDEVQLTVARAIGAA